MLKVSNYSFPMWEVNFSWSGDTVHRDMFVYHCHIKLGDSLLGYGDGDSQLKALKEATDNFIKNRENKKHFRS